MGLMVVTTDAIVARLIPGFNATRPPTYYFYVSLLTDTFYTAIGGYLCAMLAREQRHRATLALIVFGEVMGIVSQVVLWNTVPHWFAIALLVLYPPAVWVGSKMRTMTVPVPRNSPVVTP
jgi:hypothetical protein